MNKSNMVKLAGCIVNMMEGKESKSNYSLCHSLIEMPAIKRAQEKIDKEMYKNICSINDMAKECYLVDGIHYKSEVDNDGDYVLISNYLSFYNKFLAYCELRETVHEVFILDEFKTLLRTQSYCKSYNKPVWFENSPGSYSNKSLYRSVVLKIKELKEKEFCINAMV